MKFPNNIGGIQTRRLDFECVRASHASEVWPLLDDDRMWTYFPELRPATLDDLRGRYAKWERGAPNVYEKWLNWLCRGRAIKAIVGSMQATVRHNQVAHIAYAFYPPYQRKGYAREATQAVIEHLHDVYGIRKIYAEMDARNEASYRLVESLGFVRVETRAASGLGGDPKAREYRYELTP